MSTIYITERDVSFKVQSRYLKVFQNHNQRFCIPIRNISQFIVFGNIKLPKHVIQIVRLNQIPVLYLSQNAELLGRVENPSATRPKYLSYQQRNINNTEFNHATAESMIWAKLHNQHTYLRNWTRNYTSYETKRALDYLTLLMDNLPIAPSINDLRDFCTEADKVYYCAFASLLNIYSNGYPGTTAKRVGRFLHLGNHLLTQYIYTLLNTVGLHPDYAIFHDDGYYELPLAWDFAAEFRAPIVDDLVLNFARNLNKTNGNGNGKKPTTLLKRFLQSWEAKLKTFILHPYVGEVSYRQCMDLQVKEYLKSLLGDVEYYRPLALKFNPNQTSFTKVVKNQKPVLTLVK
ncbi:MAG: CRISPR-associated endonuclease Cas1 [Rivularia sp. (in: cyanobacteria)]